MKNKKLIELAEEKNKLFREKQILYSWNWFYLNSTSNLYTTRYHKTNTTDRNGNQIVSDIYVNDRWHPDYGLAVVQSSRAKEDRRSSISLNRSIKVNFSKISENHQESKKEYEKLKK